MNVIFYRNPQNLDTVSIASMCQHGPHWEYFFFLLKYNNSNSSTGECVWTKIRSVKEVFNNTDLLRRKPSLAS